VNLKKWLFIDKADLTHLNASNIKGAREPWQDKWNDCEFLSVQSTKVGKTIMDRMPRLKHILVRAHGRETINYNLCANKKVVYMLMRPYTQNCVDWILDNIDPEPHPVLIVGNGSIGTALFDELLVRRYDRQMIRGTDNAKLVYKREFRTIIGCCAPDLAFFNKDWFNQFHQNNIRFVSICRGKCVMNHALVALLRSGKLESVIADDLQELGRAPLLSYETVTWTEHTAWKTNFDPAEHACRIEKLCRQIEGSCC